MYMWCRINSRDTAVSQWWRRDALRPRFRRSPRCYSLSQLRILQGSRSISAPRHGSPPCWGAGFSHRRNRSLLPSPHTSLQPCQRDQSPHPPASATARPHWPPPTTGGVAHRRLPGDSPATPRRLPGDSPATPRRLPGDSPATPRRLPGDSPATPRRLPGDSPATPGSQYYEAVQAKLTYRQQPYNPNFTRR